MNARRAIAVVLLLSFPASTFAQTPANRLDLSSLKHAASEPEQKPLTLSFHNQPDFPQAVAPPSCAESQERGKADAAKRGFSHPWFWSGVGLGFALSSIGWVAAPAIATMVKPAPKQMPADVDAACYAQGYGGKALHKNAKTAFWGSVVGTVILSVSYGIFGEHN